MKKVKLDHKMSNLILPTPHPYIVRLKKSLNDSQIKFTHFKNKDMLIIRKVVYNFHIPILNTMMMPESNGIKIIALDSFGLDDMEQLIFIMTLSLDTIIPDGLEFNIIGVS